MWQHQLSKYCVHVQCSKMYTFFKVCLRTHVHANTHVHPYVYNIHVGGLPKFGLSVFLVSYQVFKPTIQNGKGVLILYFCLYLCVPFYFGLGHEFHKEGTVVISFVLNC